MRSASSFRAAREGSSFALEKNWVGTPARCAPRGHSRERRIRPAPGLLAVVLSAYTAAPNRSLVRGTPPLVLRRASAADALATTWPSRPAAFAGLFIKHSGAIASNAQA
ncbi:hypothetical protein GWK47_040451 [Chionoecetes opilio]|uniref:Uncharacterized protein n=1 Tax=Chionoecetes opilio TaxID=41210 RepID=A0A8J4YDB4_CHIOP|nr:hypothetical protein GWK47_040451 [Chionoecetes opilio]